MKRDNSYLIGNQFAKGSKPNATAFKSGSTPWNKGKKGIHLSPDSEFKKGRESENKLPIGTKTIRTEKSGTRRRFIKTKEPNVWIEYAKYLWLKSGRKIKKGMCLHHISRNSLDDRVKNLILVSRQDHPKLHNRWNTKN